MFGGLKTSLSLSCDALDKKLISIEDLQDNNGNKKQLALVLETIFPWKHLWVFEESENMCQAKTYRLNSGKDGDYNKSSHDYADMAICF